MPRTRGPGLLAIFYGVVSAVLTAVWAYGFYQYWWENWGIYTSMAALLITGWWPFLAGYAGTLLFLAEKKKIGVAGAIVWALLPAWPFVAYYGYAPRMFEVSHRWNAVVLGWYPILVAAVLLIKYSRRTSRTVRAAGRFTNRYFKVILVVLGLATGGLILYGLLFTKWTLVGIALGIPAIVLVFNWVRTLALGFDNADAGFIPGEIKPYFLYDGSPAAPQRIHPIGIVLTGIERARRLQWTNPFSNLLPRKVWIVLLILQICIVVIWFWVLVGGLSVMIASATFPEFPISLSQTVKAVMYIVTFGIFLFGFKGLKPLWFVIFAPLWSIPILWAAVVITDYWSWWGLWPLTLVPHFVYSIAVYSRTLFGFTDGGSIFITIVSFHWWGVSTRRRNADAKAFKQDDIELKRVLFWKYGTFDPGILQLGQPELVVATHLPHPEKFRDALAQVQAEHR